MQLGASLGRATQLVIANFGLAAGRIDPCDAPPNLMVRRRLATTEAVL